MPDIVESACGKAILLGEHAVLFGEPAIAIPIRECTTAVGVSRNDGNGLVVTSADAEGLSRAEAMVRQALVLFNRPSVHVHVDIQSTIPPRMGLGSSAALSVALVRALHRFFDESPTSDQINGLALALERFFHSRPSGIDNTVVTYEIPIYFRGMNDFSSLDFVAPCIFLLIDCGHRGITEGLILRVREDLAAHPKETRAIISEIGNTVEAARVCIGKGDGRELGRCMSHNHDLLRRLHLSTPQIDQMIELMTTHGALGAKLTGAGGGGYVIALFDDIPEKSILDKASIVCLQGHGIDRLHGLLSVRQGSVIRSV